jgi:WD40 repeat-containing protein SMU1
MNLDVNSKDVIRLILQFMKESNLSESLKSIQSESDVVLNTVDNMEQFVEDIQLGRWDSVLTQVNNLKLSKEKLIFLYEQIILELLENGEKELAKEFLLSSEPMLYCKTEQPERFLKLEHLCKRIYFNLNDAYETGRLVY